MYQRSSSRSCGVSANLISALAVSSDLLTLRHAFSVIFSVFAHFFA
jgi:hypothetical protein